METEDDKMVAAIMAACRGYKVERLLPGICHVLLEVYTQSARSPNKEEFLREVGKQYDSFICAPVKLDS